MFQERILEHYENLTPKFRRLADFVLDSHLDAAFLTANEIACRLDLDVITVARFAQEIGYVDYQDLAQEIRVQIQAQLTNISDVTIDATDEMSLLRVMHETVQRNYQNFVTEEFENVAEVVKILNQSPHIWIAGESHSYDLARFLARRLRAHGFSAHAFAPGMTETPNVMLDVGVGDVLLTIVIGHPGLDTGYAVKLARKRGLRTICITESDKVLAARESDITVLAPARCDIGLVSYCIPVLTMCMLAEALIRQNPQKNAEVFIQIQENMGHLLNLRARDKK